jgi:hypothetical protein
MAGFREDKRRGEEISVHIKGAERVRQMETYCRQKGINFGTFVEELVDTFFAGEEFRLMSLSKEELVRMVLEGGKA